MKLLENSSETIDLDQINLSEDQRSQIRYKFRENGCYIDQRALKVTKEIIQEDINAQKESEKNVGFSINTEEAK